VRGDHDLGVLPFGGPVIAGDQAHAVQSTKVTEHEGIAGLGLIGCSLGEGEVPSRILLPSVVLEECVLFGGARLDVSPPTAYPVLAGVDQLPSLGVRLGTETRRSLVTTEFWLAVIAAAAVIVAAYADAAFDVAEGWALFSAIIIGYLLSRGIAKAGSRETYVRDLDSVR
jgi:hypothetical protein